jgi:hypothetical protein
MGKELIQRDEMHEVRQGPAIYILLIKKKMS